VVPQLYATVGNRSYPGVLGRNWQPTIPRVIYPNKSPCRAMLAGHLIAITGREKHHHTQGHGSRSHRGRRLLGQRRDSGSFSTGTTNLKRMTWGPIFRVSRHDSLWKRVGSGEYSAAANWHELCSTGGSSEGGGLEEEAIREAVVRAWLLRCQEEDGRQWCGAALRPRWTRSVWEEELWHRCGRVAVVMSSGSYMGSTLRGSTSAQLMQRSRRLCSNLGARVVARRGSSEEAKDNTRSSGYWN
jgi:hypothetical protein